MHGVFITPKQRALADHMENIHRAAEARSDNPYLWPYTVEEREALRQLTARYWEESRQAAPGSLAERAARHAAWCAQVDAERARNADGGEVVPLF